jgi:NAD-reducing hydrogenase large subunit
MNRTVAQIARHYVHGENIPEPLLNRIEHGIRCYDPCLSCSTHAVGQMPLHIRLFASDGRLVNEMARK